MISFPMNQKVLFINLLRIGDVLMQLPALMCFRKNYPNVETHLLINDNSKAVAPFVERYVDKVIYFNRTSLQQEIIDPKANVFSPYHDVDEFLHDLSCENYEYVFNCSQNFISAYITTAIKAKNFYGMYFDQGEIKINGLAFKQLNREYKVKNKDLAPLFVSVYNNTLNFKKIKYLKKISQKNGKVFRTKF